MDLSILDNPLVKLMLGLIAFLLFRLVRGLDDNTRAMSQLNTTVTGVVVRLEGVEKDAERDRGAHASGIEMLRTRYHDLGNKMQEITSIIQLEVRETRQRVVNLEQRMEDRN